MTDRRSGPDRRNEVLSEKSTRVRERRAGDRRDSPRVPMRFRVRPQDGSSAFAEHQGNLSLGGLHWEGKSLPLGTLVEARFELPGQEKELRVQGEVIELEEGAPDVSHHVRFGELELEIELAIARHIDAHA